MIDIIIQPVVFIYLDYIIWVIPIIVNMGDTHTI